MSVLIKVCGIKSQDEAKSVCEVNYNGKKVDFIGIILAKSPRQVDLDTAKDIVNLAHSYDIKAVGVYDSKNLDEILHSALEAKFDVVQIYTQVSEQDFVKFSSNSIKLWQACSVSSKLPDLSQNCDLVLYDAKGVSLGGNGISFDWRLLDGVKGKFGLAGGLGAHNAKDALKIGAVLLDFNSKLEDKNMIKDPQKIYEILKIIKE
jgi:phosphoribosylanthranilate isomerase